MPLHTFRIVGGGILLLALSFSPVLAEEVPDGTAAIESPSDARVAESSDASQKDQAKVDADAAKPAKKGPLRSQLTVVDVPVDADISVGTGYDNPSSFWEGERLRPVVLALQPDGGAKIGWTDTEGVIHITPIDQHGERSGGDLIIKSGLLRDLVAHDDGFAALVLQEGGMYLMRTQNEKTVFRIRLISNWCRDFHLGSLAWNGDVYAAYFGIHGGGHEGDALKYVRDDGTIVGGGWNWGCSHSIDMRVVAVGEQFMPLALSDAYPGTGFYFYHTAKRVSYTWGDHAGSTGGRIGGLAALNDKMFLAFSSKEGGRAHWSAAVADFTQDAPHDQSVHKYLEDTNTDQVNIKIARYGDQSLLVSWLEAGSWDRKFQRYDDRLTPVGESEVLPVRASPCTDMKTTPEGDIVWAYTWGEDRTKLKFVRIANPDSPDLTFH